jgi:hypothetical protein
MMTIDSPYCMHNEFTDIFDTDVYGAYIDDAITTNQALWISVVLCSFRDRWFSCLKWSTHLQHGKENVNKRKFQQKFTI